MKLLGAPAVLAGVLAAGVLAAPPVPPAAETAGEPVVMATGPEPEKRWEKVTVEFPTGGSVTGTSRFGVEHFNTIPYAEPPVGQLRFRPPQRVAGPTGHVDGTGISPSCPQMIVSSESRDVISRVGNTLLELPFLRELEGQEDCLTLDVQRPAGTQAGDKLPVLFYIFGGAFEFGGSSPYDATSLMATAVGQDQPFVLVTINHRVAGFGFMPGREVLADGGANVGLLDQRAALEWVADNIAALGGDPERVTTWGVSSGAISVLDQMLLFGGNATYRGRPLFRGVIVSSGGAAPAERIDGPKGQAVYDAVVRAGGCAGAGDTLACLRRLDYPALLRATNAVPGFFSYSSVALSYLPRPDGRVLEDSPERMLAAGRFHPAPLIIGNQEDEGTMVALFQTNLTTAADLAAYLSDVFFPTAPRAKLRELVDLYEPGLLQGAPFRTGPLNELYPGFKRVAAVLGDLTFTLGRRALLRDATRARPTMPVWSYLASYNHGLPFIGTFHAADVLQVFFGLPPNHAMRSARTYYLNFLYNQDPNRGVAGLARWPDWRDGRQLLWFRSAFANDLIADDFRSGASDWLEKNAHLLHM
ncbi:hypothetical protein CDD83_6996 [Cordyceps sp. RAO-2017]|nr:hypothetical protein CDD83_6996 [Cordyceps sp. RAO-2017]